MNELIKILGQDNVLTDEESLAYYGKDWTKLYTIAPQAIVFPTTIEQVQSVIQWANKTNTKIIPSGGRTGLSGGACATQNEIVLSLEKMNQIKDFNPIDRTVTCEAGVITEVLKNYVEDNNALFPVDFASKGSSQIGGNIATNAGGVNVLRYGPLRNWIAGLKVVTGVGEVLELNKGLVKNNTGYDLRQLMIASEGTLGVIVEATLWLTELPNQSSVMILAVDDLHNVMPIFEALRAKLTMNAFEFFSEEAIQPLLNTGHIQRPFETVSPYYVLVDFESGSEQDETNALEVFEACAEEGWLLDGVISQNEQQKQSLWHMREGISESLAPLTPYKNDLAVKISDMPKFSEDLLNLVKAEYPGFNLILFGHIGDGNIHVNILKPEDMDQEEFFKLCHHADKHIFELIEQYQGSVSAEHGVGLLKKDFLEYTRSKAEIALMKSIKQVFDPNSILNPGKIFDS